MAPVPRDDPYAAYNFQITVTGVSEGVVAAAFSEASGLDVEITPIEYRNGMEDMQPRKLPGLRKYGNITLKRGITGHLDFWKWVTRATKDRKQFQSDGSVVLFDENRAEVVRWNFTNAWPTKYTGPTLAAGKSEIAIETLVLAVETVVIA